MRVRDDASALRFNVVHSKNGWSGDRRDQLLELIVLVVLYVLQVVNAEMLRRAIGFNGNNHPNPTRFTLLVDVMANRLHPLAMVIFGAWLVLMVMPGSRSGTRYFWNEAACFIRFSRVSVSPQRRSVSVISEATA